MNYVCVDRGSDRCPCILMETGQCYSCNMIQRGKCDCSSLWQGVCPYTEYLQMNKRTLVGAGTRKYLLHSLKCYSPTLSVLRLAVPMAYGVKCKELGSFLMVKWKEWFVPLSVLWVEEDFGEQVAYIHLAVNATGPKTIGLLKEAVAGCEMEIRGPFYGGLTNRNIFDKNAVTIVVAKGIALMPLINNKEIIGNNLLCFKIDTSKLPEEFLDDYLQDMEYEAVDLERDILSVAGELKEDCNYCRNGNRKPNVFLMVSPYYAKKLIDLTGLRKSAFIMPNHSNMCCGEGYCGSCSYVDKEGVTVKRCKCIDG